MKIKSESFFWAAWRAYICRFGGLSDFCDKPTCLPVSRPSKPLADGAERGSESESYNWPAQGHESNRITKVANPKLARPRPFQGPCSHGQVWHTFMLAWVQASRTVRFAYVNDQISKVRIFLHPQGLRHYTVPGRTYWFTPTFLENSDIIILSKMTMKFQVKNYKF